MDSKQIWLRMKLLVIIFHRANRCSFHCIFLFDYWFRSEYHLTLYSNSQRKPLRSSFYFNCFCFLLCLFVFCAHVSMESYRFSYAHPLNDVMDLFIGIKKVWRNKKQQSYSFALTILGFMWVQLKSYKKLSKHQSIISVLGRKNSLTKELHNNNRFCFIWFFFSIAFTQNVLFSTF